MVVGRLLRFRVFGGYNLLNLPVVCKVVVANSLLVGGGVIAGIWLVHSSFWKSAEGSHFGLVVGGLLAGVGLSAIVNLAIVKTAMAPLTSLQQTVMDVRRGNLTARAAGHPLADRAAELLASTMNEMLDQLVQDRQRLQTLSAGLIGAQEEERKRVARDLHDEIGQMMTALLARLKLLERTAASAGGSMSVGEAIVLASSITDAVRRVAYEMRPNILDDLGLVPALEAFIEECCGRRPGIRVSFRVHGMDQRLPEPVELALYRIAREALWNVGKHSQATQVRVLLEKKAGSVTVVVEDNGVGFEATRVLESPGTAIGLLGMEERVSILGGSFRLDSRPGAGTRVEAEIPLR